ncbi:FAD-dependent oxidoreductase [Haloechinothrix sp. LS1_15]|uniref:FAD-dependent oxidoreductase n=1 Tax=Haloechinothrix sp. LS1_15 TaxID=2652248 RepID=UPI00294B853B|nr:FAD-dependent oxidoreductase [Haloechinothrix sp. LS1_15]
MRVGIIGGGLAGLTVAWLLDRSVGGTIERVTLFEQDRRLGGKVESVPLDDNGARAADLGAQHVAPAIFPTHARLLRRFGLATELIDCPLSVTVSGSGGAVVVTPHPGLRPQPAGPAGDDNLRYLAGFLDRACGVEDDQRAWSIPLERVVESVSLPGWFRREALYPLLASFVGCPVAQAPELSCRAAAAWLVRNASSSGDQPPAWYNLRGGLARLVDSLASDLNRVRVETASPVIRVVPGVRDYEIHACGGVVDSVDQLVLAAAPPDLLPVLDGWPDPVLPRLLRRFEFVRSLVGVHRDPVYMPGGRDTWSTTNVALTGEPGGPQWAEQSTWYGPITGADVFKSWLTNRDREPSELLAVRVYDHPVPTVEHVAARLALGELQGGAGVHFAGSWTTDIDSQESAVRSALATARRILPAAHRVAELDGAV